MHNTFPNHNFTSGTSCNAESIPTVSRPASIRIQTVIVDAPIFGANVDNHVVIQPNTGTLYEQQPSVVPLSDLEHVAPLPEQNTTGNKLSKMQQAATLPEPLIPTAPLPEP
uniref:Uncharacterized protein n=1 Tax=Cannabis sativa TaxID=3483 RepID=A0A803NQA1_CANSA